jgi:hypothetical protein
MDLFGNEEPKKWQEEYIGMPEYINEKPKEPAQKAIFKFKTDEDFDNFMEVVKRELYDNKRVFDGKQLKKEKSAWYPLPSRPSDHVYASPKPKCHFCGKNATRMDYRDFDGCVSKIKSCEICSVKSNEELRSHE